MSLGRRGVGGAAMAVALICAGTARAADPLLIPAGTPVQIEIVDALTSRTAVNEAPFALRLGQPIIINGVIAVPAGALGAGEIINAKKSGMGGKPGELTLAARYLLVDGKKLTLRGLRMSATGADASNEAFVAGIVVGPLSAFISGGEVNVPAGAKAQVRTAADLTIDAPPSPAVPASPSSVTPLQESPT